MKKRQRKPGGGRKPLPLGTQRLPLSTCVDSKTLDWLKKQAKTKSPPSTGRVIDELVKREKQ